MIGITPLIYMTAEMSAYLCILVYSSSPLESMYSKGRRDKTPSPWIPTSGSICICYRYGTAVRDGLVSYFPLSLGVLHVTSLQETFGTFSPSCWIFR